MRGGTESFLMFLPKKATPLDSPSVRKNLRSGLSGVAVKMEKADTYNFWLNQQRSVTSALIMSPPVVAVVAERGFALPHVVENIAPITVGDVEQIELNKRRKEAIAFTKERPC